jgi:uncharacterized Zn-finger protein
MGNIISEHYPLSRDVANSRHGFYCFLTSVVDKFLEHPRVLIFENASNEVGNKNGVQCSYQPPTDRFEGTSGDGFFWGTALFVSIFPI